jgi:YegS/Rv2252/BmrU family lipid kinase
LKLRNILIVINPAAGRSSYEKKLGYLEAKIRERGLEHANFFTERGGKGKLTHFLEQHTRINEIIILGGDGTLNYVVNETLKNPLPLGIVSNGTGNDSVKSLHGAMKLDEQVEIVLRGEVKRFDLGLCSGKAFVNGLGIGFDGEVVQRMGDRNNKRGNHLDYLMTVLRTVAGFKEKPISFDLDDTKFERKVLLMTVSNGTTFGGGFKINPLARADDGYLDVCVVNEISPWLRFWHLPKLRTGAHTRLKKVEFYKAKKVHLHSSDELVAHLDGEFVGHPPFEISILPAVLKVRVTG